MFSHNMDCTASVKSWKTGQLAAIRDQWIVILSTCQVHKVFNCKKLKKTRILPHINHLWCIISFLRRDVQELRTLIWFSFLAHLIGWWWKLSQWRCATRDTCSRSLGQIGRISQYGIFDQYSEKNASKRRLYDKVLLSFRKSGRWV